MKSSTSKISGIYKITSPTGRVYIGETVDIYKRWMYYKRLSCKSQPALYKSLLKHRPENHTFEIIEECVVEDLKCRERFWQDEFDVTGNRGLNCKLTECGELKTALSQETKDKIGYANRGRTHTLKSRLKMSISQKSREKRSKEFCKQISERQMGGDNPAAKIVLDTSTGIFYMSIKEASEALELHISNLSAMLNGRYRNKTNLIFC